MEEECARDPLAYSLQLRPIGATTNGFPLTLGEHSIRQATAAYT